MAENWQSQQAEKAESRQEFWKCSNKMLYKKQGFPEESELVMCTVSNIQYHSVFADLDEYGRQGMIHISEISPGRIRNIRDYVKEGKKIVCKVLRVNSERGHIDLSLRRVNEAQRKNKVNELKQEQKAEVIIEHIAKALKKKPEEIYQEISANILKSYDRLFPCFMDIVEGTASLEKLGVEKKLADMIEEAVKERIKRQEVEIEGSFKIVSFSSNGLEDIKKSFKKIENPSIALRYDGGGSYHIIVIAKDYKIAEKELKLAGDSVTKDFSKNAEFAFARIEK